MRALQEVVGESGTIMAYVDYEPTPDVPYFDPRKSPARPSYGVFAEVVRTWPGAVRSLNPGASMAAVGARAAWLCRDHPLNYGYGKGSPLEKLIDAEGKVLLLGSDLDQVTLLHYAEHVAGIPGKVVVRLPTRMLLDGRIQEVVIEEFDTGDPVVPGMPEDYFECIVREFIEVSQAPSSLVGDARSFLLPARELVRFAVEKMDREYGASSQARAADGRTETSRRQERGTRCGPGCSPPDPP